MLGVGEVSIFSGDSQLVFPGHPVLQLRFPHAGFSEENSQFVLDDEQCEE